MPPGEGEIEAYTTTSAPDLQDMEGKVSVEQQLELEVEFEYALGTSYRLGRTLHLGLEAKGNRQAHYIGPTIAHGSEHLWVALGSAFALSTEDTETPKFQLRLLLGIGL